MILESREVTKKYGSKTAVIRYLYNWSQALYTPCLAPMEAARPPG